MAKDERTSGKPRRLGRGLSALVQTSVPIDPGPRSPSGRTPRPMEPLDGASPPATQAEVKPMPKGDPEGAPASSEFQWLPLASITASPFQPRTSFDTDAIEALGESIKRSGMMQPLVVRPLPLGGGGPRFELVAGERRLRAAQHVGLERAPAIVRMLTDQEAAELALVENLQRRDLNAIERAFAFQRLRDQFGLSQEQIGERVGLDRSSVANIMRLCELEPEIRELISDERIGAGHGKALLGFPAGEERIALARRAVEEGWSVRRLEREPLGPAPTGGEATPPRAKKEAPVSPELADLERRLSHHLGTKVRVKTDASGVRGTLSMSFYDLDQFDGLLTRMGFSSADV
ncbi:MAG: ParB/RepB/Spo0J family partition protein [Phycisphaerales bacterium JB059]